MRALVQRVRQARVEVDGRVTGAIGRGLLVLVCAEPADEPATAARLVAKLLKLRIFADADGRMNRSLQDLLGDAPGPQEAAAGQDTLGGIQAPLPGQGAGLLIVSQFTLAADLSSGNRPSFTAAAPPEQGRRLYEAVLAEARARHPMVAAGEFGADMQVHLVNDGPVTIPMHIA